MPHSVKLWVFCIQLFPEWLTGFWRKRGLKRRSVFLAVSGHSSHSFADYDCYARISHEGRWPGAAPLHCRAAGLAAQRL